MNKFPVSYYATIAGSLAIAVGLVVVSYGHIRKFAIEAGAAPWEAAVIAVTVDALVVLSIAAIGHARGVGHRPPAMAKVALIVGIVATTGANIHHGLDHGWAGIVVSLWVPVAAELAYQLAMSAVRIGATGGQEDVRPAVCGGHVVAVATVMARVTADRQAAEEAAAREAAAMAARPVICGRAVPVATVAATLPSAAPDVRPVICGHVIPVEEVAGHLAATDTRPVICGQVVAVATVMAMPEPLVICGGHTIPTATLTAPLATATPDTRPAICGQTVPLAEVAATLTDDRPVICGGHLVSVAELLARTPVATPDTRPAKPVAKKRPVATAKSPATGDREDIILEWLTAPDAPDDRVATATGADIVRLLADHGHQVSERTGRRILKEVREALGDLATT